MGNTYTVGAKLIIKYDQSEIKTTIDRLNNFVKANPIIINNIKIDSSALNNIKSNLEKLAIKLDNVSINNIKVPSNATKELKSKIESISFSLGNLKLNTSKIDGKKVNLTLFVPPSEITKLKQQIEGLRPLIRVQVQGQSTVATPGSGSLTQAKTFADSLTASGQYKGNTLISYDYDQAGKLIAVLKNAQNETIRLKYQFDEASRSFQQIGSSTRVPDLLNQSTVAAQRTFADLRNVTNQFNILKQQSGSNPIDFKTQKLIPDLELLNAKIKTLSTGMQQVTQTYKLNDTQTMSVSGNYNLLRGQIDSLSTSTGNLANRQIGLGEATSVALQRFPLWIAVSTLVMGSLHKMQEAFTFMSEQSKLFTNLQLEMTNTNLVFGEITSTANQFASAIGSTTSKVMQSIAVFGTYSSTLDDVLTKSKSAITLSNITGQGVEQTSDELMGIMSQFRLGANDITSVTDSVLGSARNLQMDFPKAVSEISSGLRTVGSVAKEAGLSVSETTGILSTMIEVSRRSGAENSNALRTVISRISAVGEESDPEEFKGIEKKFYNIGIAIKSSSDTIRPLGEILSELGERWKTLNDVERQSIAQASAGMYRRNAFISLMSNYDKVLQNTTAAQESEGVTAQKQEIYNNSLSASVARLTAAWEKFYLNSINTDTWKNLVKGLTVVISGFADFASVMGGIPTILATVVLTASLFSTKFQGFMSRSFLIAPMLAFKASVIETSVVMRQFSGYANTWRTNPFIVGFQMAKVSVIEYIASIRLAIAQQTAMGRTGWTNALGVAITGISGAMRSLASSAIVARIAMAAFQAVATLGLSVALSLVIGKVMGYADSWIHAKEKAQEAFDSLQKSVSSLSSEVSQSETLISTYDELSVKKNKTTEETQKLSEATEKLSTLLPQSIEGFDSEGKAILGSAESLREYLDLKRQELEINKQKLVSDFYANESSQIDDIIEKQNKLNDLKDKLSKQEQIKTNIIGPNNSYTPDEKVSLIANKDLDINKIKGEISEVQGEILKANSAMSSGLKAVTQTELESLNLSSNSLSNFSKSYMGIISEISKSGESPAQVLSTLFDTFKTDINIKPIIDEWNTSLQGLQKGNIDASKAEKIHQDAVDSLTTAMSRANPNMKMEFIKPFVEGLLVLSGVAPKTEEKIVDFSSSLKTLQETMSSSASSISELQSAMKEYSDSGTISLDTIIKLSATYPELLNHLGNEAKIRQIITDKIKEEQEVSRQAYAQMLMDSEEFYKAKVLGNAQVMDALSKLYNGDLSQYKSLAEAKAKVDQELIQTLASAWSNYYRAGALVAQPLDGGRTLVDASGNASGVNGYGITPEMKAQLSGLKQYSDQMSALASAMDGIAIKGTSGIDFSGIGMSGGKEKDKKEKASPTSSIAEQVSIEESLIRSFNTQAEMTAEQGKLLEKQIATAKSANDYNLQLSLTNDLIKNQKLQITQLGEAKSKIEAEFVKVSTQSGFQNTSQFVDAQGEVTLYYQNLWNASSVETQKQLSATFDKLSKLQKAWKDNSTSVLELADSQKSLQQSLLDIKGEIADQTIQTLKDSLKKQEELTLASIETEQTALETSHQKKLDILDEEATAYEDSINKQIDAIDKLSSAEDYNKNLKKSQSEAQGIQNQINILSKDTSISGKSKLADLQKQLAEKNSSIDDMQTDHTNTLRKQNLQDQLADYKKDIDAKKKAENTKYDLKKSELDAEKVATETTFNELMNNERYWAEQRLLIINGNIDAIKLSLAAFYEEFTKDITGKADLIKGSFEEIKNIIDDIKNSAGNLDGINMSMSTSDSMGSAYSGALTPSWGSGGKSMIVHQNELILNATETSKFFKIADILSKIDVPNILKSISLPTLNIPSFQMPQLANNISTNTTNNLNPVFNLTIPSGTSKNQAKEIVKLVYADLVKMIKK